MKLNRYLIVFQRRLALFFWYTLALLLSRTSANAQTATNFPLRLSPDNRYLTDAQNKPFLIKEISAWGLIQALSETDESAYLDSIKKKGFNTVMVSIISYDTRFAGNPPAWQGQSPFNTKWDFSTYNTKYFEHADRFLQMAETKGILVLLVPCYLGYKGDPNQGWWPKLLTPTNNIYKSNRYGQFLGERYKGFNNIIWVAGGDNNGEGTLYNHMDTIILGIKHFDQRHLWTGHFASDNTWSTLNRLYAKYIDIDGLYDWVEADLGTRAPQYNADLKQYAKGKMIFQMDQSYEHDIPHKDDNENYQWIRRKNYDGLLSGCAGASFSPGTKGNPGYVFKNWQQLMSTEGMQEAQHCFNIFSSRRWSKFVPDEGDSVIVSGRGEYGSIDYVCAAGASDHSTYMAYLPVGQTVDVNLKALNLRTVNAWWYDPRSGEARAIGILPANTVKQFTAPTNEDWLLVIDNAALRLPMR
jgi:hypothetical protein